MTTMTGTPAALDYLRQTPFLWINLDRSTDRAVKMARDVLPLFEFTHRVPAVDGQTDVTDAEAQQFVDEWLDLWRKHEKRLTMANQPPGVNFRPNTQKANVAIKRSHIIALQAGLAAGLQHFAIGEDDISPRSTLWDDEVPLPPAGADMTIWSGGLPLAGTSADDAVFKMGRKHTWSQVVSKSCFNALGAGLYVVNRHAAETLVEWVSARPMSYDHAWGFALSRLTVYRLVPNAFAQEGPSVRNHADRKPALKRKKAER